MRVMLHFTHYFYSRISRSRFYPASRSFIRPLVIPRIHLYSRVFRRHARMHSRTHTYTYIRVHFNEIVQSVPPSRQRRPRHSFSFIMLIILFVLSA